MQLRFRCLICCYLSLTGTLVAQTAIDAGQPANPAGVEITGVVSDSTRPIPDVLVIAFDVGFIAQTRTDESGAYHLTISPDQKVIGLFFITGSYDWQYKALDPALPKVVDVQLDKQQEFLSGRIIDNQGINVPDLRLQVSSLQIGDRVLEIPDTLGQNLLTTRTNASGQFQIPGATATVIGAIKVTGPGIVEAEIHSEDFAEEIVCIVQPSKTVLGAAIDLNSQEPVSDVEIVATGTGRRSTTDDSGRFRITGLPAFQPLSLVANPNSTPHLSTIQALPQELGFEPVSIEIQLQKGVWVNCRVKEFGDNLPANAELFYMPAPTNQAFLRFIDTARVQGPLSPTLPNADGLAKLVALTGPGVVVVVAQGYRADQSVKQLSEDQLAMLTELVGRTDLTSVNWIEPEDLNDKQELSIVVSKGRTIRINIENNGIEISDLIAHRCKSGSSYHHPVSFPEFDAEQFYPGEQRQIVIHSGENQLGAAVDVAANGPSAVSVRLTPTGRLHGQIVNKEGKFQQGLRVTLELPSKNGHEAIQAPVFTDANGRFNFPSVISGLTYRVSAARLTTDMQQMTGLPKMDNRWFLAEELQLVGGESVDLGTHVLDASTQPKPKRLQPATSNANDNSSPQLIRGTVVDSSNDSMANVSLSINTWPSTTNDSRPSHTVLAQSISDENGKFQFSIDDELRSQFTGRANGKESGNVAIVATADKLGTVQLPLGIFRQTAGVVRMPREMIIRATINVDAGESVDRVTLRLNSSVDVYDNDSIKKLILALQAGESFQQINDRIRPLYTISPEAGGLERTWNVKPAIPIRIRRFPLNSVFQLTGVTEQGHRGSTTVIARPMAAFEFRQLENQQEKTMIQGSRVKLSLSKNSGPGEQAK